MTSITKPAQALPQRAGALIMPSGFPCCDLLKIFPERARWETYEWAKQQRAFLERHGWTFEEPYDTFVRRVCEELQL